jgi:ABC-type amino acid transport substrate-binding protein/ABC-type amino acid transport system permease subunit
LVLGLALFCAASMASAQETADEAIAALRDRVAPTCTATETAAGSVERQVICDGVLRVGLREDYPRFGEAGVAGPEGYEADIARHIATRLGVDIAFSPVTPINRIAKLGSGEIDLAIATMGHNTQRDPTVHFLRPHYFQSETVVVGSAATGPLAWEDLETRLVCTTVGNYSNVILAPAVGRLMLFPRPQQLIDAMQNEMCPLIAQDDTLLLPLIDPEDGIARFDRKLGFAPVPWGMAMPLGVSAEMSAAMTRILIEMHRDGTFLRFARDHGLPTAFLTAEQARWGSMECGVAPGDCLTPPLDVQLEPSAVAGVADVIEATLARAMGLELRLGFMESAVAWQLFLGGLGTSILAVILSVVATVLISFGMAALWVSRYWVARALARVLLTVFLNVPVVLVLVIMSTLMIWAFSYSFAIAMASAILAICGINGCYAGSAIAEAYAITKATPTSSRFIQSVGVASVPLKGYIFNSVRGISAATVVGVPDLVNALNDITAFSGAQTFYYWLLVIFYIVAIVLTGLALRWAMPLLIPGWRA